MDVLDKFSVLAELSSDEKETLSEFLDPLRVSDAKYIFRAGDESDSLLLIAEGRVRLEHDGEVHGAVGVGEVLGGVGLVLIGRRPTDAVADGPVLCLSLTRERYLRIRSESPSIALKLLEGVLQGFAQATRKFME